MNDRVWQTGKRELNRAGYLALMPQTCALEVLSSDLEQFFVVFNKPPPPPPQR
jgi:hypothetical protein